MNGPRKILIALNGAASGMKDVLIQGIQIAREEKCWITVVNVVPPYEGDLSMVGVKDLGNALDSGGQKMIDEIKEIAKAEKALIKTRLEEGEAGEKIIEVAEEEHCDLIVMGGNKTGWFEKMFGKNVVDKVINHAPCPLMVVGA